MVSVKFVQALMGSTEKDYGFPVPLPYRTIPYLCLLNNRIFNSDVLRPRAGNRALVVEQRAPALAAGPRRVAVRLVAYVAPTR
jgi:hypothetical protein